MTSTKYQYFGCFNNNENNNLSLGLSSVGENDDNYTITECENWAVNNNAAVFSLQNVNNNEEYNNEYNNEENNDDNNDDKLKGKCFLSNSQLTPIQQIYLSTQNNQNFNKCNNGIGTENSQAIYINNEAFSFFDDITVENTAFETAKKYETRLNDYNDQFDQYISQVKNAAEKNIHSYNQNDIEAILNNSGYDTIINLMKQYISLKLELELLNKELSDKITERNTELKNIDDKKILTELKLSRLINSDNAAQGTLIDINYQSNVVILENSFLIIVSIIFIIIQLKFKKNKI